MNTAVRLAGRRPLHPALVLCVALSLLLLLLLVPHSRAQGIDSAADDGEPCPALSDGGVSTSSSSSFGGGCQVNCFRPDPVCGVNGVTYWCGCQEAACAGVRVAKRGFCEVGSGGSGLVSGQAFLLIHIVWLIILGFAVLCGFL